MGNFPSGEGMGKEACFVALLPCFQMKGRVGMGRNFAHPLMGIEEMVACSVALLPFLQFGGRVGMGRNSAHLGLPLMGMGIEEIAACSVALLPFLQF